MRSPVAIARVANTPLPWIGERRRSMDLGIAILFGTVGTASCHPPGLAIANLAVDSGASNQHNLGTDWPAQRKPYMLRITRLTDYATVVLTSLAAEAGRVHSATGLAERSGVEAATVAKLLKLLAKAGLVTGFRGVRGGYQLARPANQIPLIAIVEALEGPLAMTACSVHGGACGIETHCGVRAGWQRINDVVVDALKRTTLADMLTPAAADHRSPSQPAQDRCWPDQPLAVSVVVVGSRRPRAFEGEPR